jgi:hypothetical protein
VEERTVELAQTGVTVLVGPNEIGKSSIAEAIRLLFEHLDSSKHRKVAATKPVHRDEGAEIEAEVEAGAYRFTYFKRFHKRSETRLRVTAPRPEELTGREAHERVEAILAETVDLDLWRALWIDQGRELALPRISDSPSLAKALDAAAGTTRADDAALSLFDRARTEFEAYYTPTGRERRELIDLADAMTAHTTERETLARALRDLEHDVDQSRALERQIATLTEQQARDEHDARVAGEARRALELRSREVELLAEKRAAAKARAEHAERDMADRSALVTAVASCTGAHEKAAEAAATSEPATLRPREALEAAAAALASARAADIAAAAALVRRQIDSDLRHAELDHAQLGERLARIVTASEDARAAEQTLATSRLDSSALAALREAQRAADEARIRAEAGSPEIEVAATRDVSVRVGAGDTTIVPAGTTDVRPALDDIVVDAPGVVRVTIRPAVHAAALRDAVEATHTVLRSRLAEHGVADLGAAEAAHAVREEAARTVARHAELVRENLRDLTREDLERRVRDLAARAARYHAEREPVPGAEMLPPTFDAAREALADATRLRERSAEALEEARRAHELTGEAFETQRIAADGARTQLAMAARDLERARISLEDARARETDEALRARCAALVDDVAAAAETARKASAELEAARPDDIRMKAEAAAAALQSTSKALRTAQDKALEVRTRLAQTGQQGLAERLDAVETRLLHAARERDAVARRAAAARLLYETLGRKRDEARRGYVAPLRDRIVRLGRLVFGADLDVELGEDLAITHRTREGRTVPFESLSGGAKEQLDLVTRAAAAMVVCESQGVPLILDDALGYSDAERLRALGAVLAVAGQQCQVIVLTCVAERYRHIHGARVLALE